MFTSRSRHIQTHTQLSQLNSARSGHQVHQTCQVDQSQVTNPGCESYVLISAPRKRGNRHFSHSCTNLLLRIFWTAVLLIPKCLDSFACVHSSVFCSLKLRRYSIWCQRSLFLGSHLPSLMFSFLLHCWWSFLLDRAEQQQLDSYTT